MTLPDINPAFARRCLALCLLVASLLAVPTTFAAPADGDDAGHWLAVSSFTELLDSLEHWVANLSAASRGEAPAADDNPSPQDDETSQAINTRDDKGIGPALDPTG